MKLKKAYGILNSQLKELFFIYLESCNHENVRMDEQQINSFNPEDLPNFLPQKPKKKKPLGLILLTLLLLVGCILVIKNIASRWNTAAYDPITLKPKTTNFLQTVKNFIFNSDTVVSGQEEDRINILLLGIGGPGHDGPYLSDTNIILSIKPSTNQIAMVSVPRDLMAKIDGHGYRKINFADAFGEAEQPGNGGEYARKIFENTFNIQIPYYVRVDFTAFKDLVDAVGGITIDVQKSFTDSSYPGAGTSYQTISFTSGVQNMDGERALVFARSRHGNNGEGSDFARAKRQQMVLAALKEKMLSAGTYLNPVRVQQILQSISNHVKTNLELGQLMYLASLAKEMNSESIKTLVLDDSPTGFLKPITSEDGAFLLVPKTGDYINIDNAIENVFETTSTQSIQIPKQIKATPSAKIEIQNGTWRLGLAARTKQKLEEKGFTITTINNSSKRPITTTGIYIINKSTPSELIKNIADEMKVQPISSLPDWLEQAYDDPATTIIESGVLKYKQDSELLIILGENASD